MAFTSEDLAALDAAIKGGHRRVAYRDRTVEYHSLDEMMKLRGLMQAELLDSSSERTTYGTRRIYPECHKGT